MLVYNIEQWIEIQGRLIIAGLTRIPNGYMETHSTSRGTEIHVKFNTKHDELIFLLTYVNL